MSEAPRIVLLVEPTRSKHLEAQLTKAGIAGTCLGHLPLKGLRTNLTPRQEQVLRNLAVGKGVKEIARLLHISPKTVETHRSNVISRLGIYNIPGLVRYALQSGLVPVTWLLHRG